MEKRIQLAVLALTILISSSMALDYCRIRNCAHDTHVLCQFPFPGPSNPCDVVIRSGLTQDEKDLILILHNDFRTKVQGGGETRGNPGPQPPAKNITLLRWDAELALSAQRWAEQCTFKHDQCRNSDDYEVGQSINQVTTERDVETYTVEWVIRKWYNEVDNFNKYDVRYFRVREAIRTKTYRYAQIVWGRTRRIGCGAMRFFRNFATRFLFVCNYGPTGNRNMHNVYEIVPNYAL